MDKTVPAGAAVILDGIGDIEAPRGYNTIYGNNQGKLTKQITSMTLDELIGHQTGFTKNFGSSASGRYQFMRATLLDLKKELKLSGNQIFSADLQDRLGFHLLKRRKYELWALGVIGDDAFMVELAKEWASFPVPTAMKGAHRQLLAGQSYYAGDGLNKALVSVSKVKAILAASRVAMELEVATQVDAPVPPKEVTLATPATPEPVTVTPQPNSFWANVASFFNSLFGKG